MVAFDPLIFLLLVQVAQNDPSSDAIILIKIHDDQLVQLAGVGEIGIVLTSDPSGSGWGKDTLECIQEFLHSQRTPLYIQRCQTRREGGIEVRDERNMSSEREQMLAGDCLPS